MPLKNIEGAGKIIAIYARVSTARQEEDGTIATQLSVLRDYAQSHRLKVLKEYIDDGWSGDVLARPALDELRSDASKKKWTAVLIYDPDRLARRYSYQELVMDELRERQIEIMFITVPAPRNSEEKILHGVRGLFAEYERAKIAERFRLGKLRKVKEGHVLTQGPFGYTYILKQGFRQGYFVVNDEEARTVKLIFDSIANDRLTLRQLVRRLHQLGIRPQRAARGVWNSSTLSTLLRNKAYIGEAHWNKSSSVVPVRPLKSTKYRKIKKTSRKIRPVEEWCTIPVPPIIDKAVFERARLQLDTNQALCVRNRKNQYLLAGKIRCICGMSRGGEGPLRGKHLYYRCSDRVRRFPLPRVCRERGINARVADELVWNAISELMSSPSLLHEQIDHWLALKNRRPASDRLHMESLERDRDSLKEQIDRHNQAYAGGLYDLEQLSRYTNCLKARLVEVEREVSDTGGGVDGEQTILLPKRDQLDRFTTSVHHTLMNLSFSQKRAIVVDVVQTIVGTQHELKISGCIPVQDHVEFQTSYRYRRDSPRHLVQPQPVVPFEFAIALPPPLRSGVDYGFLPGSNVSKAGKSPLPLRQKFHPSQQE
jgi:site-specific DNA recombinase